MTDRRQETAETERLALKAVDLGRDDAVALSRGGHAIAFVAGDNNSGAAFIDRALALNPNLASAWLFSGWVRANLGDTETSLQHLATAIRMSPVDPLMFDMQNGVAMAHLYAGRFEEASSWAERSLREKPDYLPSLRFEAASYAHAGRTEDAQKVVSRILGLDPGLRISNLADVVSTNRAADVALLSEGLRKAGLPE
ncbi:tetratricopeptide repeat protein [Mesorhizobium sp. M1396]|uniref:tetratricopeptide repeat protein n=1 Tax=Mesorhizobium sp. M1396 TaxID=2957095 RepID=UPI00333B757C